MRDYLIFGIIFGLLPFMLKRPFGGPSLSRTYFDVYYDTVILLALLGKSLLPKSLKNEIKRPHQTLSISESGGRQGNTL